jgi:YD repeat-containing protein
MKPWMRRAAVSVGALSWAIASGAAAQAVSTTYGYDSLGRLISKSDTAGNTAAYTYDPAGNRTQMSTVGAHAPIANNDAVSTLLNTAVSFNPLTNDSDPDGVALSIKSIGTPAHGSATFTGSSVTYTPANGYVGGDSFSYTIWDGRVLTATATIAVTVASPGPPTAGAVSLTASYNGSGSAALAPGGQYTSVAIATAPAHGSAALSGTTATYTPTSGYYGADSFTYTATGPGGTSAPGTVSVTVPRPGAPTAAAESLSVGYNTAGSVGLSATGIVSSYAVAAAPSHGSASVSGSTATYTPTSGYYGTDSFTYTATGPGGTSSAATVTVTVTKPTAPTAGNVSLSTAYNTTGSAALAGGGVVSSYALATNPTHGTASVSGGAVTYTPTSGYYGSDSFTYTATGPGGTSSAATVSVTVPRPAAPTAAGLNLSVGYNTAGSIGLAGGGVVSSYALATNPSHGAASVSGSAVTYTPTSGYYGSDSFTYTATGPGGTSSAATVSVTVAKPAAPTVGAASLTVGYNTSGSVSLAPGGIYTTLTIGTNGAHGTASISGATATYTPTSGYYGADSFTYLATGPGGTSSAATVSVTVSPPAAPTVSAVSLTVAYNGSAATALAPSGVYSSLAVAAAPSHGTATISGSTVTYTPTTGYAGADSFTYTATGPGGTSAPATVSVTTKLPGPPMVNNEALSVAYNTSGSIGLSATGVYAQLALGASPAHGTASITGNNGGPFTATYTPTSGYYGSDSFTYYAYGGPQGQGNTATVSITVGNPPAPTAGNVNLAVAYGGSGSVTLAPGGSYTSLTIGTNATHGTASISGSTATYTPVSGYYGSDSFTYIASGPGGSSSAATVSVTVANPPAPAAANISLSSGYNASGSATLSASGLVSAYALASNPAHGSASVSGGTVTYTPSSGYYGSDSFTYTASGPGGTGAAGTVSVSVANPPAPSAANIGLSAGYNSAGSATLSASGVVSSYTLASNPSHGSASISGGTVIYTPASGYYGSDSFTYVANGPGGTGSAATVSVNVANPPAPSANGASLTVAYNTGGSVGLSSSGITSSYALASNPSHGSASISGSTASYTPASGYYGSDSFTYAASGPGGTGSAATISVTVNPPPPTVAGVSANVAFGAASAITLAPSGVYTSLTVTTAPSHGSVTLSGATATYTPTGYYYGADSFAYSATGPGGTSSSATVSVSIPQPPAPTVDSITYGGVSKSDGSTTIGLGVEGYWTGLAVSTPPRCGTLGFYGPNSGGPAVSFSPSNSCSTGPASFSYVAIGPGGTSAPATVSMIVTP